MDRDKRAMSRRNMLQTLGALGVTLPTVGCGYLLYPERHGNTSKAQLDLTVVLLDSLLCLFFVLPGVIAFVVDYNSGCLYEAGGMTRLRRRMLKGRRIQDIEEAIASAVGDSDGSGLLVLDPAMAPTMLDAETLHDLMHQRSDQPGFHPASAVQMDVDSNGQVIGFRIVGT